MIHVAMTKLMLSLTFYDTLSDILRRKKCQRELCGG